VRRFEEHLFSYAGDSSAGHANCDPGFRYRLLAPQQIEPGCKYPLALFLHGAGECGTDNKLQLLYFPELMASDVYRARFPCFLLAPQCRPNCQWVDVPWDDRESTPMQSKPNEDCQAVADMLDQALATLPIDRARVYLTGLSMGGYGCWELATRNPQRYAAVVPICGGGDESLADRLLGVPIWAVHGETDPAVPVERSRRMIAAIRAAGGSPNYSELAGVGHHSWVNAYGDPQGVIPWMFAQVNDRCRQTGS
jgi:predicted peptidase